MKTYLNEKENKVTFFSEDNDWTDKNGKTIVVWTNCIVPEEQYNEFEEWINGEFDINAESVGSYQDSNGSINFIFTINKNINQFAIRRFDLDGIRWFYDVAWEINGGITINNSELTNFQNLLNRLGLKIKEKIKIPQDGKYIKKEIIKFSYIKQKYSRRYSIQRKRKDT